VGIDLLAGQAGGLSLRANRPPRIAVVDSGLGGLTVHRELVRLLPAADFVFVADDAAFPYGRLSDATLVARVVALVGRIIERHAPDLVVIACNTASTLALPVLRARFPLPFVGTVPAIKPAAALSRTGVVSVLGTPGTVARDYTRELIQAHAAHCAVTLVGSPTLAGFAEAELRGAPAVDADIAAAIAPCFVQSAGKRTDVVVLACTHYPLLAARFTQLAPWPVAFVDPAPAIARRVLTLVGGAGTAGASGGSRILFTGEHRPQPMLEHALGAFGFAEVGREPLRFEG
jgi:glutamate racemase